MDFVKGGKLEGIRANDFALEKFHVINIMLTIML
jgi:hypothetical protein